MKEGQGIVPLSLGGGKERKIGAEGGCAQSRTKRFLAEYEDRFEREYGFFRPIVKEVVERYLDCGNPLCGFARIRCTDRRTEHLLMFSCKTRGFCPLCQAKHLEEWGGVDEAGLSPFALRVAEEEEKRIPSQAWAAMIRKVYEVDPMICPKFSGRMKVLAFITEIAVVDRIIDHPRLTFAAAKPPPSHVFTEVTLMAAERSVDYF